MSETVFVARIASIDDDMVTLETEAYAPDGKRELGSYTLGVGWYVSIRVQSKTECSIDSDIGANNE